MFYSMVLKLDIDHREAHLIEALNKQGFDEFTKCNLDVADIRITSDDAVVCIIERKTISDLNQSITDGRWKDQKNRLLTNYPISRIMYIVEGCAFTETSQYTKFPISYERVRGAIINTLFRDNIKVVCVSDVQETARFVVEVFSRFKRNTNLYIESKNDGPVSILHHASVSSMKKHTRNSCMNKQVFAESTLSLVPGVSLQIASTIMEKYGTLQTMLRTCREQELADIKTPSGRRIGSKIAKRIIEYLFDDEEEKNETI